MSEYEWMTMPDGRLALTTITTATYTQRHCTECDDRYTPAHASDRMCNYCAQREYAEYAR